MKTNTYELGDFKISLPVCYERTQQMPGDPENSIPFLASTDNTECFAIAFLVNQEESLPRDKDDLIYGIKDCLSPNQGLIEVETENNYVYSIVKTLRNKTEVQYSLTFQSWTCSEDSKVLNIHAFFNARGTTGIREAVVYELCRQDGTITNGFEGWIKDPYTNETKGAALMNLSEDKKYDNKFPTFPLSMCRELAEVLKSGL